MSFGLLMTAVDDQLTPVPARELEALRSRHRSELAERLRLARGFGGSADNDELLAVL